MGAGMARRYDQIAAEYFTKKYLKQKNAEEDRENMTKQ